MLKPLPLRGEPAPPSSGGFGERPTETKYRMSELNKHIELFSAFLIFINLG
jgi:hypothetical protein